jgi:hypothetical protein
MWAIAVVVTLLLFAFIKGLITVFKPDKVAIIRCVTITLSLFLSNIIFSWDIQHIEVFLGVSLIVIGVWEWVG